MRHQPPPDHISITSLALQLGIRERQAQNRRNAGLLPGEVKIDGHSYWPASAVPALAKLAADTYRAKRAEYAKQHQGHAQQAQAAIKSVASEGGSHAL